MKDRTRLSSFFVQERIISTTSAKTTTQRLGCGPGVLKGHSSEFCFCLCSTALSVPRFSLSRCEVARGQNFGENPNILCLWSSEAWQAYCRVVDNHTLKISSASIFDGARQRRCIIVLGKNYRFLVTGNRVMGKLHQAKATATASTGQTLDQNHRTARRYGLMHTMMLQV